MKIAGALWGKLGAIPHTVLLKIAVVLLAFSFGLACGNTWTTARAVREATRVQAEFAASREAAIGEAYARATMENNKKLAELAAQNAKADRAAHETYQKGIVDASRAKQRAERQLQTAFAESKKLRDTNDGLKNVNQMLAEAARSNPGCVLPGRVREILDAASGASDSPSDRASETDSPAVPSGSSGEAATPTNMLTCEQLSEGYVLISEWGRNGWAEADSWKSLWLSLGFN